MFVDSYPSERQIWRYGAGVLLWFQATVATRWLLRRCLCALYWDLLRC
jgi:hypothetical protein